MTRQQAALAEARAMVRADGGPLYTVTTPSQTTALGHAVSAWTSEGLCEHDARHLKLELELNGYQGSQMTRVR